jgi:signal recognition particle subunit SRP54
MHRQMADMMKKLGRQKGGLGALFGMGGGVPQPDPAMLEEMQKSGLGGLPAGLPGGMGLPGGFGGLPGSRLPGLPGLGGPRIKTKFKK